MFTSHSQIIGTLFGLNIYYYGVIMALAIIVGTIVADKIAIKFFSLKKDIMVDLAPYLIIFGIIGARIYYCCLNHNYYLRFPTEIIALRHGGLSIHGALIGGLLGLFIFALRHKVSPKMLADVSVIGLSLAQAIGRWGNFFNSEAFGLPTNLPWKLYIAPQYRPIPFENYEYFHPTFLYESIADLMIFFILISLLKFRKPLKTGNYTLIYLILYSTIRIFIEHLRIDSIAYVNGIPVAMFVSFLSILIAIILLIINNYNYFIKHKES